MNDTLKAMHSRYSCRGFLDRMPSDSDLSLIADAGLASPSAYNAQNWQLVVCKNKEIINKAQQYAYDYTASLEDKSIFEYLKKAGGKIFYDAPVVVFIARPEGEDKSQSINSGIVLQSIAISASSLGINSLMCGFTRMAFADPVKAKELASLLKFPEGYVCNVSILLGYEKQGGTPHQLDKAKVTVIE